MALERLERRDFQGFNTLSVTRFATAASVTFSGRQLIVGVTDTSAPRTITLATRLMADDFDARIIIIKDEGGLAGTNTLTIATEGSETIDGSATATITSNYGVVRLYSDRVGWFSF